MSRRGSGFFRRSKKGRDDGALVSTESAQPNAFVRKMNQFVEHMTKGDLTAFVNDLNTYRANLKRVVDERGQTLLHVAIQFTLSKPVEDCGDAFIRTVIEACPELYFVSANGCSPLELLKSIESTRSDYKALESLVSTLPQKLLGDPKRGASQPPVEIPESAFPAMNNSHDGASTSTAAEGRASNTSAHSMDIFLRHMEEGDLTEFVAELNECRENLPGIIDGDGNTLLHSVILFTLLKSVAECDCQFIRVVVEACPELFLKRNNAGHSPVELLEQTPNDRTDYTQIHTVLTTCSRELLAQKPERGEWPPIEVPTELELLPATGEIHLFAPEAGSTRLHGITEDDRYAHLDGFFKDVLKFNRFSAFSARDAQRRTPFEALLSHWNGENNTDTPARMIDKMIGFILEHCPEQLAELHHPGFLSLRPSLSQYAVQTEHLSLLAALQDQGVLETHINDHKPIHLFLQDGDVARVVELLCNGCQFAQAHLEAAVKIMVHTQDMDTLLAQLQLTSADDEAELPVDIFGFDAVQAWASYLLGVIAHKAPDPYEDEAAARTHYANWMAFLDDDAAIEEKNSGRHYAVGLCQRQLDKRVERILDRRQVDAFMVSAPKKSLHHTKLQPNLEDRIKAVVEASFVRLYINRIRAITFKGMPISGAACIDAIGQAYPRGLKEKAKNVTSVKEAIKAIRRALDTLESVTFFEALCAPNELLPLADTLVKNLERLEAKLDKCGDNSFLVKFTGEASEAGPVEKLAQALEIFDTCYREGADTFLLEIPWFDHPMRLTERAIGFLQLKNSNMASAEAHGSHIVLVIKTPDGDLHVKVQPYAPAVEAAVAAMSEAMSGGVAAPTVVGLIQGSEGVRMGDLAQGTRMPVLLARTVKGINVRVMLDTEPDFFSTLPVIDNFSDLFCTELVMAPQDGKADNYMLQKVAKDRYTLICIDNDLALAMPFVKNDFLSDGAVVAGIKSVIFLLPYAEQPVSDVFRRKFLSKSPDDIMLDWLQRLQTQHDSDAALRGLFTDEEMERMQLPLTWLPDVFKAVYERICTIHALLVERDDCTHNHLFAAVYPDLYAYYQDVLARCDGDVSTAIESLYLDGIPDDLKAKLLNAKRDRPLTDFWGRMTQVNLATAFGDRNSLTSLASEDSAPELVAHSPHAYEMNRVVSFPNALSDFTACLNFGGDDPNAVKLMLQHLKAFRSLHTLTITAYQPGHGDLIDFYLKAMRDKRVEDGIQTIRFVDSEIPEGLFNTLLFHAKKNGRALVLKLKPSDALSLRACWMMAEECRDELGDRRALYVLVPSADGAFVEVSLNGDIDAYVCGLRDAGVDFDDEFTTAMETLGADPASFVVPTRGDRSRSVMIS